MTSGGLVLLFCLILSFALSRGDLPMRAQVTIRFNCRPLSGDKDLPCEIRGHCTSNVSGCYSHRRKQAGQCKVLKDFSRKLGFCGGKGAGSRNEEVFSSSQKLADISKDLFFNVFRTRSSMRQGETTLRVSVQVLPYLREAPRGEWINLTSSPPVDHFLHISGRLTCLQAFSGRRCQGMDRGLLMSPGDPAADGVNFSQETIFAAIAAGCCCVMLFSLSVWCCVKRRAEARERGPSAEPFPNDVYELPYDDLQQNRASYVSLGQHDSAKHPHDFQGNGSTLESTVEEGPELPPRRVSISSEDICSRGEGEAAEENPFF